MMRLSPLDYRGMILGIPRVPLVVLNPYPLSLNPIRAPTTMVHLRRGLIWLRLELVVLMKMS